MSKGSARRPGTIPDSAWDAIFKPNPPECAVCRPDPCICTDDGPGQDAASKEVKTHYERRKFAREGV